MEILDRATQALTPFLTIAMLHNLNDISKTLKIAGNSEGKCWRHRPSDRKQVEMSLHSPRKGLQKASRQFTELRLETRSRLKHSQYWTKMTELGERSKQIRSKEQKRLHKKEVNLRKRGTELELGKSYGGGTKKILPKFE